MPLLVFIISIFFTILATIILAYVSMVTMIGPWLAPTIALVGSFITRKLYPNLTDHATQHQVAALQAIAAGGGTIAVGVGFALPMLYFLDPVLFSNFLKQPFLFISLIGLIVLCAGSFGIFLGKQFAQPLIHNQKLPFPSSLLTFGVIQAQGQKLQARLLALGFVCSSSICLLRDGFLHLPSMLPKTIYLIHFWGNDIALLISPMLVAIGFSAGTTIILPLVIGLLSKIFLFTALQWIFQVCLHVQLPSMSSMAMGFCSGLLLAEIVANLRIITLYKKIFAYLIHQKYAYPSWELFMRINQSYKSCVNRDWQAIKLGGLVTTISIIFLCWSGFSILASLLFLALTCIATYHICIMSGHIGMVQFGRFSTFIMIPMLLLFSLSPLHLTLICLFFHICAASASDYLFDYNIFELGNLSKKHLVLYQLAGLVATAWVLGLVLWLLFTNFQLGSPELFAQRGKTKALLIQSLSFDYYALLLGLMYGLGIKRLRMSPAMTLGGFLMPSSLIFSLIIGSIISALTQEKKRYAPLCAGIMTGESMWVIFSIISRLLF